ncbi:MAG: DsbA family protein [Actinomycetia bacterium]|nr:DsbA family protein [Actinomycetes bacterium]
MAQHFDLTYDYLCPFARNANEAVIDALEQGANWSVTFRPFSLQQNHNGPDETPVWDVALDADLGSGVLALLWSLAVRDHFPESFARFHVSMFAARHDQALDVGDEHVIRDVAADVGLDVDAVLEVVASGVPQRTLELEHSALVETHEVFGVPTFIVEQEAVFVRVMDRHNVGDVKRIVDMAGWTNLNEFKRTRIPM